MNLLQIIGNVGQDITKTEFENGQIGTFTVATNRFYKNAKGEKIQQTEWHNCLARGKQVDLLENYMKKGDKIYLAGQSITETWEKEGQKFYKTVLHIEKIEFLSSK